MVNVGICSSQLKSSWLTLKGDMDARTKSPDMDTQSLPQSPGTDKELQRLCSNANSTYPRELGLVFQGVAITSSSELVT